MLKFVILVAAFAMIASEGQAEPGRFEQATLNQRMKASSGFREIKATPDAGHRGFASVEVKNPGAPVAAPVLASRRPEKLEVIRPPVRKDLLEKAETLAKPETLPSDAPLAGKPSAPGSGKPGVDPAASKIAPGAPPPGAAAER